MKDRTIKVDSLTRVEGEGALALEIRNGRVQLARLNIYEPPRFFEAFVRGRSFLEIPDIVARICGICPAAHQVTAVQAMENACGVEPHEGIRALRRLLVCGEWIESHALHIHLLHSPDFMRYPDAIRMAEDHPAVLRRGLELKKIGNRIMAILGGREVHPVTVKVGGFYRVPVRNELAEIRERLKWACSSALETVHWTAELPFPDLERSYTFIALRHVSEYAMNDGDLVSSTGMEVAPDRYEEHFNETQVDHSTALHSCTVDGGAYLVGPLARFNLNFDRLPPNVREAAKSAGFSPPIRNPFKSIVVRALELLYACEEALRIIEAYAPPPQAAIVVKPRPASGFSITEAPRGALYHAYHMDEKGHILKANIIPPTAQNQKVMEEDLRDLALRYGDLPKAELTWRCEQAIRNYDPCISCATHLMKL